MAKSPANEARGLPAVVSAGLMGRPSRLRGDAGRVSFSTLGRHQTHASAHLKITAHRCMKKELGRTTSVLQCERGKPRRAEGLWPNPVVTPVLFLGSTWPI